MRLKLQRYLLKISKISMWHRVIAYFILLMVLTFLVLNYFRTQVVFNKYATEKLITQGSAFYLLQKREEEDLLHNVQIAAAYITKQPKTDIKTSLQLFTDLDRKAFVHKNNMLFFIPKGSLQSADFYELLNQSSIISKASNGKNAQGREVWGADVLKRLGFNSNSKVKLHKDTNTFPLTKSYEENGLVYAAAIPLYRNQVLTGVLVAAKLYNKEDELTALAEEQLKTPVFLTLGDSIIAAKGKLLGSDLLGHKLSREIVTKVLDQGEAYYGKAVLLGKTVYGAFEPIYDVNGKKIGVLSIVLPLQSFQSLLNYFLIRFSLLVALSFLLGLIGILWFAREINKPVRALLSAANEIAAGVYPPAIPEDTGVSGTEMSRLVTTFNDMVATLSLRERELERTASDIEEKNMELVAQQEELQAQQEELLAVNQEMAAIIEELDSTQNIIFTLALAVEAKDLYTKGHSERVAKYAELMAKKLEMTERDVINIKNASLLHDIGKIGINDVILNKPDKLSEEEFAVVQQHPLMGEKICTPLRSCANILSLIRHHHEWYNGSGYPDGLIGEEISLGARIMAVADAFDAMTTDRPYRKGMTIEKAVANLQSGAGQQWDPQIVRVFIEIIENNELPRY